MKSSVTEKVHNEVIQERKIKRSKLFDRIRPIAIDYQTIKVDYDYLAYYDQATRQIIIHSLLAPIPAELPPLSRNTISYYRRSQKPVFMTKQPGSNELDGHLTYESLQILHSTESNKYPNFAALTKQFQRDLPLYLSVKSKDILENAVMAAGHRVIGKQKDIIQLAKNNRQYLWVLVNHVYQNKISYKQLFPYLLTEQVYAFQAFSELTNTKNDESIPAIMADDSILECLLEALKGHKPQILSFAILIIGNILGQCLEYIQIFQKFKLVKYFNKLLYVSNQKLLKDVCWMITNFACTNSSATQILLQQGVCLHLMDLLINSSSHISVKLQIIQLFNYLVQYANKKYIFQFLYNSKLISACTGYLCTEDVEFNLVTLRILYDIIELGEEFPDEEGLNCFVMRVQSQADLCQQIEHKKDDYNQDIRGVAYQLLKKLPIYAQEKTL